jgi:hypothetical protein
VRKADLVIGAPYYEAWHDYSRVWRRSLFLFLLFFPGGVAATSFLLASLFPTAPGWLVFICLAPWVVAAALVSQAPVRWRCPRCGKPFHSTTWGHNGFARRCMHCHLPKWAPAG